MGSFVEALRAYEAERIPRVLRVQAASQQALRFLQAPTRLAELARDLVSRLPESLRVARQAWMFDFRLSTTGSS